jgi:Winged helix DNA-binding domain
MAELRVSRRQAIAYRLRAHALTSRLPASSYELAARYALQDSVPRSALLSIHARVEACEPSAWTDPRLTQTYSPRAAVHVLPLADFGVFTVGRLPLDAAERREVQAAADRVCRALSGRELRPGQLAPELGRDVRSGAATGRIALRWTTSSLHIREVPPPAIDVDVARSELCRRHVHAYGPTTPTAYAWWSGTTPADAEATWRLLASELVPVRLENQQAWILAADETALTTAEPARGVRLLPSEDLRLFGYDRTGLFVGPGLNHHSPLHDYYYLHGLVVDGAIVGVWSRRQGQVRVKAEPLSERTRAAVEAEALAFPIPGATMDVEITEV